MRWRGVVLLAIAVSGQQAGRAAAQETYDDLLARVADRVPAFCGVWVDEEAGQLKICLTDDGQSLMAARDALVRVLDDEDEELTPVAVKGEHGWTDLMHWYGLLTASDVWSVAELSFTDIDEEMNRIVIGLIDLAEEKKVREALAEAGIPNEVVVIEEEAAAVQLPLIEETVPSPGVIVPGFPGAEADAGTIPIADRGPRALTVWAAVGLVLLGALGVRRFLRRRMVR